MKGQQKGSKNLVEQRAPSGAALQEDLNFSDVRNGHWSEGGSFQGSDWIRWWVLPRDPPSNSPPELMSQWEGLIFVPHASTLLPVE